MVNPNLFNLMKEITHRPKPFEFYTAEELWNDKYISQQLLGYHLDPNIEMVSRRADFVDKSVNWMVPRFNITFKSKILDIGCGPGLYSNRLAQFNAQVTGLDISKRSIEFARQSAKKNNLQIEYIRQNYLDYVSDTKFNLILMIFCDFCSLSAQQQKILFTKFHSLLKSDGAILLDVFSYSKFDQRDEFSSYEHVLKNGFWAPEEYFGFLNTFKYEEHKLVVDKYTLIQNDRIRTFYNWVKYYSLDELKQIFLKNGFKIESCYANVAGEELKGTDLEFAVVGRKQ